MTDESIEPPPAQLRIELSFDPRVQYALLRSGIPVVKELKLYNETAEDRCDLQVSVEPEGELGVAWSARIDRLPAEAEWVWSAPEPHWDVARIAASAERTATRLRVRVESATGGELLLEEHELEIQPVRHWGGMRSLPELLASFVCPEEPALQSLRHRISAARDGGESVHETTSSARMGGDSRFALVLDQLETLALADREAPAEFARDGLDLRAPEQILASGGCSAVERMLLAASLLEAEGARPVLVLTEDHALLASWKVESAFAEGLVLDAMRVRKRIDVGELVAIDLAVTVPGSRLSREEAERAARRALEDDAVFLAAWDVVELRRHGFAPLMPIGPATAREVHVHSGGAAGPATAVVHDRASVRADDSLPRTHEERRVESWKRRLLDLTFRNRLLAFRDTKSTLPLLLRDSEALEDALSSGAEFTAQPRPLVDPGEAAAPDAPELSERVQEFAREELAARRIVTLLGEEELDRRCVELWRRQRTSLEESGANTLYLALGMLRYRESPHAAAERFAPILLVPLELSRPSVRAGVRFRISDDETAVNATLLEKLRTEFGIDTSGLAEVTEGEEGYDVAGVLQRFRRATLELDGFEVRDESWIAVFSFQKFLMWRDLEAHQEKLLENPVVAHLVSPGASGFEADAEFPIAAELDETWPFRETFCPLDADSSQLAAVAAARAGRSFVLEGPPGTGKSQTITNLIAQCLAEGKRVLFVSEKRAALEVVTGRLEQVGLGPFCLELHSNKASKREVLQQLRRATEVARQKSPEAWEDLASEIERERRSLNEYVRALHAKRSFGESVYRVTAELCSLRDAARIPLPGAKDPELDHEWIQHRRESIERLRAAYPDVAPVPGHVFEHVQLREWRATLHDDLDSELPSALDALEAYSELLIELAQRIGLARDDLSTARVVELCSLAGQWLDGSGCARGFVEAPDPAAADERANRVIQLLRDRIELAEHVATTFGPGIRDLDVDALHGRAKRAASSFWPLSWLRARGVRAELRPCLAAGAQLRSLDVLVAELDRTRELRTLEAKVAAEAEHAEAAFGAGFWRDGAADPDELEAVLASSDRLRGTLRRLLDGLPEATADAVRSRVVALACEDRAAFARGAALRESLAELLICRDAWDGGCDELQRLLETDYAAWEADADWPRVLRARLRAWQAEHRGRLRDWVFWKEAEAQADAQGLEHFVRALRDEDLDVERLGPAFERSFRETWWNTVQDAVPALRSFHSADHERRIESFRQLDREGMALARELVIARLCERVPEFAETGSESSEMGILQRELRKKRRHLPMRRLFAEIPNLLARLQPCVLMSPLSVAQYLDAGGPSFDVVVFDEASQIPVWDAVGALARADSAIVVGDTKQLPPTSFFQVGDDEDGQDELDVVELESVLDECSAAGFRSLGLAWHYRSRHESLITFSNAQYYDHRLHTFPGPVEDPEMLGVSLVPVPDGVYDRSRTRTNRAEAESVVRDLVSRLRLRGDERSYGVVTFSRAQQELVEDLLDRERAADPGLDAFFHGPEPVFVKNLENVQGDERDVIFFSICYGPDERGRVAMHFGPLNLAGGERRLNVAVTRARRQLIVHATLRPEQIDLTRTRALGVQHLRRFLEYADRGPGVLASATSLSGEAARNSAFEMQVAEGLRKLGHEVDLRVGCSRYRVDLAVRDPQRPGAYLLGIECDGSFYHSARTARDRDRIRAQVLAGLGWQLERIWCVDWWRNPERELEKLSSRLASLRSPPAETERETEPERDAETELESEHEREPSSEPEGETRRAPAFEESSEAPAPPPAEAVAENDTPVRPYRSAELGELRGSRESFYEESAVREARDWVRELLSVEAPMTRDHCLRRLAEAFEVTRLTAKARSRAEQLLNDCPHFELDGVIWSRAGEEREYGEYRVGGAREAHELPSEEVANAAAFVLRRDIGLPRAELARETAKQLGYSRLGRKLESAMARGIEHLIARGGAVVDGERVSLP